jgi:hypothetical protein
LLTIYGKSARDTIPAHILRKLAEELDHSGQKRHRGPRCKAQHRGRAAPGHQGCESWKIRGQDQVEASGIVKARTRCGLLQAQFAALLQSRHARSSNGSKAGINLQARQKRY